VAGDYRYTLPIEVPPGRAGMAPSLSLSYSSSGENGIAGVGWALTGLSSIKVCNKTFATDGAAEEGPTSEEMPKRLAFSPDDTHPAYVAWCLDGQRLVAADENDPYGGAPIHVLRTEFDTFARIEQQQEEKDNNGWGLATESFKVFLKDGRKRTYLPTPIRLNEFLLATEEDRFGNSITYSYTPPEDKTASVDTEKPAPVAIAEETANLATITYTGRIASGDLGSRKIWLKYEDTPRPDPIFVTDSIPATSSRKRLKSIDCYAPAPAAGTSVGAPTLAWSYALSYQLSAGSARSLLTSVKRIGTQGSAQFAKQFDWQSTKGGAYNSRNYTLPQGDTAANFVVLDVDHDGRDELLYSPQGAFSPHVLYSTVGAGAPLTKTTPLTGLSPATLTDASIGDIDGDGQPEIIAPDRDVNAFGIKPYQVYAWSSITQDYHVATQANKPWLAYLTPVSDNVEQPIFLADMDGDGLPDMIQAQFQWMGGPRISPGCVAAPTPDRPTCLNYNWYYFHNIGGSFDQRQEALAPDNWDNVNYPPRSGSPFSAPVTTDRAGRGIFSGAARYDTYSGFTAPLPIKIYQDESVPSIDGTSFPSCVVANFTGRGSEPVCDDLPYPWRTTVFDSDGDGRDELYEYFAQTVAGSFLVTQVQHVYWDDAGKRHDEPVTQTPLMTGDFNGDGLPDAIFYDMVQQKTFAALNAGATRDVMVGVRNETAPKPMETVTYSQRWSASTVYEKTCAYPQTCMRQGMNVVVERDVYQGSDVDKYEHNFFNYEDPREDVYGRGFLGFATVRTWNPDRLSETITEFDNATSVNGVYFAMMPSRVSLYTAIGAVDGARGHYNVRGSVVNSKYAVDAPSKRSYFRHPTTWDSAEWETDASIDMTLGIAKHFVFAGPAPIALRQRTGEVWFDSYGNQTYSRSETVGGVKTEVTATYDEFPKIWLISELTQTLTTVTEPGNGSPVPRQVSYTYGKSGELTSNTIENASSDAAIKYTTSFKYNSDGLVVSKTGSQSAFLSPLPPGAPLPVGDADRSVYTEYDPDEGIFPRKIWNDLGHVVRMLYHPAFGEISDEISANGVWSQVVYDGLGRTRKVSRAGETPVYIKPGPRTNSAGELVGSYVDTNGAGVTSTHSEYDEFGRVLLQQHVGFDSTGIFSKTKYDDLGRVQFVSRAGFGQPALTGTTYSYDGLSRVVSIASPNGQSTGAVHTFFETRAKDPLGHDSYAVRDVNGRVIESGDVADGGSHVSVAFKYGNFNQIKTIADSQNNVTRVYYDQRGRRVNISEPDTGVSTFRYNAFGELIESDAPGINGSAVPAQTSYKRDALGRVVHIDNGDGATDFTWDTSANGVGLLASQSSPWVAQTFEYDWFGRPFREAWTVDHESFDMLTSYDGSGRVSTITYPEVPGRTRFTVERSYSSTNYFASVAEIDSPAPINFWEVQTRNADDQLVQGRFGNGRLSKRAYEPTMGRLKSISDMACVGVNCVGVDYSLGYTYLPDGNVDTRIDNVSGRAEKFGYDALNRLTSWELTSGANTRKTGYNYDDIGNLLEVKVVGSPAESNTYYPSGGLACSGVPGSSCPGPHALDTVTVGGVTRTFEYDTRGRQVKTPERKVTFSEANLPRIVETAAGSTVFSYDAAGSRVKKVGPSEETLTLGGLYERRVTSSGIQHIFLVSGGDGNMTQVGFTEGSPNSDRVEYVHTDALGTTGAVTDGTGGVTRSYQDPFGARIAANGSAFSGALGDVRLGFTGHVSDDDVALVNMKGRIYDPSQRRFISPDPVVSMPANAQSYNRYTYANNNPIFFTDPSGFDTEAGPQSTRGPDSVDNHTSPGGPLSYGRGFHSLEQAPSAPKPNAGHPPPTPYKAKPAPAGYSAADGVHHDRHVMVDLDSPGPGIFAQILRSMGDHEPGARAAKAGIVVADWARTGVPPDGPELKVALTGMATVIRQAAPLLQTAPGPDAAVTRGGAVLAPVPVSPPEEGQIVRGVPVGRFDATVLAGHGREPDFHTIVPEGTDVLLPRLHLDNDRLHDFLGNQLEVDGESPGVKMEYFPPGSRVPNLILSPPVNPFLHTEPTSTTVRAPTYLSDILKPNMGVCVWAACRVPSSQFEARDSQYDVKEAK
jgi:RHS repeat-associated protein